MKLHHKEKKQLLIFTIVTFGLPVIMGILMGTSYYAGNTVSCFVTAQSLYPALGTIAAVWLTHQADSSTSVPKSFYAIFSVFTISAIILCVLSIVLPSSKWDTAINWLLIEASIGIWISYFLCESSKLESYGLLFKRGGRRQALACIGLFLVLYFSLDILKAWFSCSFVINDTLKLLSSGYQNSLDLIGLIPGFFLSVAAYFGEEYGWRGFLQPFLQKHLGMRQGIILLGLIWGIWHLPINLFYYAPTTWLPSFVSQLILCISIGIFLGYVYLKTKNIWVPIIIHYLHNNVQAFLYGEGSVVNQVIDWKYVSISGILLLIFYGIFLNSKIFEKKETADELNWSSKN